VGGARTGAGKEARGAPAGLRGGPTAARVSRAGGTIEGPSADRPILRAQTDPFFSPSASPARAAGPSPLSSLLSALLSPLSSLLPGPREVGVSAANLPLPAPAPASGLAYHVPARQHATARTRASHTSAAALLLAPQHVLDLAREGAHGIVGDRHKRLCAARLGAREDLEVCVLVHKRPLPRDNR